MLEVVLRKLGLKASHAGSKAEVEDRLQTTDYALIVLDLSLVRSDAVEVLLLLSEVGSRVAILLISGHDEKTLRRVYDYGMRVGMHMLPPLRKPFKLASLRELLRRYKIVFPMQPTDRGFYNAIVRQEFELWYQPVFDLHRPGPVAARVLIRFCHPELGLVAGDHLFQNADSADAWCRFVPHEGAEQTWG